MDLLSKETNKNVTIQRKMYNLKYNAGQKKRNSEPLIFCELPGRGRSTMDSVQS